MTLSLGLFENNGDREDFPYDTWLLISNMPFSSVFRQVRYITLLNESTNEYRHLTLDFLPFTKLIEIKLKEKKNIE